MNSSNEGAMMFGLRLDGFHLFRFRHDRACSSFGSQLRTSLDGTWFFIEFTPTHFLFDSAAFDQLPEPTYRLLNTFPVANHQFDHTNSPQVNESQ